MSDVLASYLAELNKKQADSLLQLKEKRRNTYYAGNTELADFDGIVFSKKSKTQKKPLLMK